MFSDADKDWYTQYLNLDTASLPQRINVQKAGFDAAKREFSKAVGRAYQQVVLNKLR